MNEELIKQLRELPHLLFVNLHGYEDVVYKAADAIEELSRRCEQFQYMPPPAWIPVTERLPEIDEKHHCSKDVLAYLKGGGMCFTALEENIFGQACFECERNPAVEEEMIVTHWMPLPSTEGLNEA